MHDLVGHFGYHHHRHQQTSIPPLTPSLFSLLLSLRSSLLPLLSSHFSLSSFLFPLSSSLFPPPSSPLLRRLCRASHPAAIHHTMSAPRLTFLYPFLFAPARQTPSRTARSAFTAGAGNRHSNNTVQQRYGTANEPLPHLGPARTGPRTASRKGGKGKEVKDASSLVQTESRQTKDTEAEKEQATATGPTSTRTTPTTTTTTDASKSAGANDAEKMASVPTAQAETQAQPLRLPLSSILDSSESQLAEKPRSTPPLYDNALQTVLNMPPPDSTAKDTVASPLTPDRKSDETAAPKQQQRPAQDQQENRPYGAAPKDENRRLEHQKPPHISTPPYVHHFDTYSLVRRLEEGGWTQAQSITLMKAVRTTLSSNMNLAHQGLVSKSDVENEAYLFSAACSELHTEISTKRKAEAERSRTDRTQLTHEVDILSQRMTQESGNMKDELKGMFDDRKMAVRNEQRDMERKVRPRMFHPRFSLNPFLDLQPPLTVYSPSSCKNSTTASP